MLYTAKFKVARIFSNCMFLPYNQKSFLVDTQLRIVHRNAIGNSWYSNVRLRRQHFYVFNNEMIPYAKRSVPSTGPRSKYHPWDVINNQSHPLKSDSKQRKWPMPEQSSADSLLWMEVAKCSGGLVKLAATLRSGPVDNKRWIRGARVDGPEVREGSSYTEPWGRIVTSVGGWMGAPQRTTPALPLHCEHPHNSKCGSGACDVS